MKIQASDLDVVQNDVVFPDFIDVLFSSDSKIRFGSRDESILFFINPCSQQLGSIRDRSPNGSPDQLKEGGVLNKDLAYLILSDPNHKQLGESANSIKAQRIEASDDSNSS